MRHLQEDPRQTNRDIARKVGIGPSTCLERIRLLRERGVIRGYHADISGRRSFSATCARRRLNHFHRGNPGECDTPPLSVPLKYPGSHPQRRKMSVVSGLMSTTGRRHRHDNGTEPP
ncbi:Lrp/AsnC family transcriptional regulator [Amycolatopsis sp. NPDC051106]|uniref:Lrp/AsnC family transcriptional regulator n=1 Tax=unclassified Amycolatopsis TaxID=2618356 RepID=UPI003441199E